jgi:uncharacterized protein
MKHRLIWDEAKRVSNLAKHGLDFRQADTVLDSRYRLDVPEIRGSELRVQSFSYVFGLLTVLTLVHTQRGDATRVISFRHANLKEWERYDDWLNTECERHDP